MPSSIANPPPPRCPLFRHLHPLQQLHKAEEDHPTHPAARATIKEDSRLALGFPAGSTEVKPSGTNRNTRYKKHGAMEKAQAQSFLESLLNKKLRVHTTDERMFWGDFKCTDPDRNIVLQYTYEYRQPSAAQRAKAAAESEAAGEGSVKMELIHRYLGLVVVPGEHIVKIEKEDFASQMK